MAFLRQTQLTCLQRLYRKGTPLGYALSLLANIIQGKNILAYLSGVSAIKKKKFNEIDTRTKAIGDIFQNVPNLLTGHDELVHRVVKRQDGQHVLPRYVADLDV
jgi:hypothetical protein